MASGVFTSVYRRTGSAMFPGCPGPVLAWLDRYEPKVLDAAASALYCKDMVFQRLTGVRATDVSDASMPFLDPTSRRTTTRSRTCWAWATGAACWPRSPTRSRTA